MNSYWASLICWVFAQGVHLTIYYHLLKRDHRKNKWFIKKMRLDNDRALKQWKEFSEEQKRLPGDEWMG